MGIRHPVYGVGQGPLLLAPKSIFTEMVGTLAVAADQTPALKAANQLKYNETGYSYNGESAPKFYGYSGVGYGSEPSKAAMSGFSPSLFVVPGYTPTQKVTLVNSKTLEPEPAGREELQKSWEAVPVPIVSKVPAGTLVASGTDKHLAIWRPSTDEYWGFWLFQEKEGKFIAAAGEYTSEVSKFNGIYSHSSWGARACNLMLTGGQITQQDLIEVLEGKPIRHALAVALPSSKGTSVLPAKRSDGSENTIEKHGGEPNPAYGLVDAITGESQWFRFPLAASPTEYGINPTVEPIAAAVFEAIREYGMAVMDSGAGCQFYLECPVSSGSPYAFNIYSPLIGAVFGTPAYIPEAMKKPGLPAITEHIGGANNAFSKQPWQLLELLEPRSS